jgi:hypothetical protein
VSLLQSVNTVGSNSIVVVSHRIAPMLDRGARSGVAPVDGSGHRSASLAGIERSVRLR